MLLRFLSQAILASLLLVFSSTTQAAAVLEPGQELAKLITVDAKVSTLTTDLMGDSLDLYKGTLAFSQTDINLRGTSALPVRITRGFRVGGQAGTITDHGAFGDWVLAIPRIEVIMPDSLLDNGNGFEGYGFCGEHQAPPRHIDGDRNTGYSFIWDYQYWSGKQLNTANGKSRQILNRSTAYTASPPGTWNLVTKDHWAIRCIALANGMNSDGGYEVRSPSGTTYRFDVVLKTAAPTLMTSLVGSQIPDPLARTTLKFVPSAITDVYGNTVTYTYANNKLVKIKASDGREITLAYNVDGLIDHITANPDTGQSRTWQYNYAASGYGYHTLDTVTRPDGSQWSFDLVDLGWATVQNTSYVAEYEINPLDACHGGISVDGDHSGAITHPLGATATFRVAAMRHGRAAVPKVCQSVLVGGTEFAMIPADSYTLSLIQKTLTGPGLPQTLIWSYSYSATPGWYVDADTGQPLEPSEPMPTEKTTTVFNPEGHSTQYTFDITWGSHEGDLKAVKVYDAQAGLLRTTHYTYKATPQVRGNSYQRRINYARAATVPLKVSATLTEQATAGTGTTVYTQAWSYDAFDRPTLLEASQGASERKDGFAYCTQTVAWILGGVVDHKVDMDGNGTLDTYRHATANAHCDITRIEQFGVMVGEYGYNANGTLDWVEDALDNRTNYNNYKLGIPRQIIHADSTDKTLTINADGTISSITDERNYTTSYGYDAMGRLSLINPPGSWANSQIDFTAKADSGVCNNYYSTAASWCQIITRGDNRQIRLFDALLRPVLTVTEDINGQEIHVRREFNAAGQTTFASYPGYNNPDAFGIETDYDALGRVAQITETAYDTVTQIDYLSGNRKRSIGPRGTVTLNTYQAFGQPAYNVLTKTIAAYGQTDEQATTAINRDVLGRMLTVTQSGSYNSQPVSETRRYVYDSRSQLCKRVDPETGQSVFRFDNAGNLKWSATNVGGTATACEAGVTNDTYGSIPASKVVENHYDNRNRLTATDYPGGTVDTCYQYDATSNLTRIATLSEYSAGCPSSSTLTRWEYDYNSLNLLTDETLYVDSQTFALSYDYNLNGDRSQITYPTGRVFGLAPDGLGRPTSVGGLATGIDYHANGSIKDFTFVSGAQYTASQTDDQLPNVLAMVLSGDKARLDYDYDAANNVTRIFDSVVGANTTTMSYDALNRLKTATASLWGTASYQYDPLGNLRQKTINGGTASYNYASNNRLDSVTGSISRSYQYDVNGNVTADGNHNYNYDLANRLQTVTGAASYEYDGHGKRVKHTDTASGEISYSVYSQAGKRLHQYNVTTDTPEDFVYLGKRILAKLAGFPVTPVVSNLTISNGPTDGDYTITWNAVEFANLYVLEERKNGGAWQGVYSDNTLSYAANNRTAGGYQYRIRACSDEGCGAWATSTTAGVIPHTPGSISVPTGSQMSTSYTVSWPASEGATSYTLREQYNGGTWATVQNNTNQSKSFNQSYAGDYRYGVRACNNYGCSNYRYSTTLYIVEPVVSSISINNGPGDGDYTVNWAEVNNVTAYNLQESKNSGSWQAVYSGTARSFAANNRNAGGYQYRIQACADDGCGAWKVSAIAGVIPETPGSISTPTGTQTNPGYTVNWPSSDGATRYTLREQHNGGTWATIQDTSSRSKSANQSSTGDYRYAVRACNSYGCSGYRYSATFTIELPPAPAGLAISGGSADGDYTITWNAVTYANQYTLQERKNSGNWQGVYTGSARSYAANNRAAGGYQYRVRACTDVGCGAWATSATAGVVPEQPSSINTPTGTTSDNTYTVSWPASTGASDYTLRERRNGSAWATVQNTASRSKSFNKSDGDYGYAVRACNQYGCSGYRYSATFTIEIPPATPGNLTVSPSAQSGLYDVSWNSVSGAIRYQLQEKSKFGTWGTVQNNSSHSADAFLMGPERYYYRVRACKATYCSPWSPEVSIYVSGTGGGGKW